MTRLALLMVLVAPCTALAQEPGKDDLPMLIRQMGSTKYAEREAATRAIEKIGPKALPALHRALDDGPEIGRRAKALIDKIQDRALQDAVRKPRRVRWNIQNESLLQVLEQARKDWGVSLYLKTNREELARRIITLKTEELPFWEAWEALLRKGGLAELVAAPQQGPAQLPMAPGGKVFFRTFTYTREPSARWLTHDGLQDTPVLIQESSPPWPQDASGAVRVRGVPLSSGTVPMVLLEVRPQPGLGWLLLERLTLEELQLPSGEKVAIQELLQTAHDATVRKVVMNWSHLLDHSTRRDEPSWPCDTMILELPETAKEWSQVRGAVQARIYHANVETCLENVAQREGKSWKNASGLRGKVLEARIADDGTLNLRLRLEEHDTWIAEYPGPTVRRLRPGVAAFIGPGDIAADLLQVRNVKGLPLPRLRASSSTSEDGKALELDLAFQAPLGGDDTFHLVALRYFAATVEFPFTLRRPASGLPK